MKRLLTKKDTIRKPLKEFSLWLIKKVFDFFFGFLLGVILSFTLFILISKQIPEKFLDQRTIKNITQGLSEKYSYKVLAKEISPEINPSIIVWGNDKNVPEMCLGENMIENEPFLNIYKKNDFSLLSLLPFFKQEYKLYSSFNFSHIIENNAPTDKYDKYWISDVNVEDLNGDGTSEIIVRAYSYICGSGGYQYFFVLNDDGEKLAISSTLPEIQYAEENQEVKHITFPAKIDLQGTQFDIFMSTTDAYLNLKDLDGDGLKEFIYGYPIQNIENWGKGNDCHSCPHTWLIGIYKFNGKMFIVDNNWSYGNLFVTSTKIGLYDAIGYPAIGSNMFNLFMFYYFDCADCDPFHNSSRRKSELLKIVEENYGKFKTRDQLYE